MSDQNGPDSEECAEMVTFDLVVNGERKGRPWSGYFDDADDGLAERMEGRAARIDHADGGWTGNGATSPGPRCACCQSERPTGWAGVCRPCWDYINAIPLPPGDPVFDDRKRLGRLRDELENLSRSCAGRYDGSLSADGYRVVGYLWLLPILNGPLLDGVEPITADLPPFLADVPHDGPTEPRPLAEVWREALSR